MGEKPPSCRPLFYKARAELPDDFITGFVVGQAEKVYLGACHAAMLRPDVGEEETRWNTVSQVVSIYRLEAVKLPTSRGLEIWICRSKVVQQVIAGILGSIAEDTPNWHSIRGILCGVPSQELDTNFHERYSE